MRNGFTAADADPVGARIPPFKCGIDFREAFLRPIQETTEARPLGLKRDALGVVLVIVRLASPGLGQRVEFGSELVETCLRVSVQREELLMKGSISSHRDIVGFTE